MTIFSLIQSNQDRNLKQIVHDIQTAFLRKVEYQILSCGAPQLLAKKQGQTGHISEVIDKKESARQTVGNLCRKLVIKHNNNYLIQGKTLKDV